MKKLFVSILTLVLLFTFCNMAMAQIFTVDDEYSSASYPVTVWNHSSDWHTVNTWHNTDNWYSVTPETSYFELYYNDRNFARLGVEGYANEQTFINVQTKSGNSEVNYFAGSLLLNNGLFLGGSYSGDSDNHIIYISPGFRLNLAEASFVALSCDYLTSDPNRYGSYNDEIIGYDVYYKYFVDDNVKLGGEVYFPKDSDTFWWLGINIKPADDLVIGAYYETQGDTNRYHGGFTFSPMPLIIDAEIGCDTIDDYYAVSGMLATSDTFRLGADYFKYDYLDNGAIHAKFNYGNDKTSFIFKYRFKNDDYSSVITASFKVKIN